VVRVRELATAQRRLLAALDRYPQPGRKVIDRATDQVRALNRELRCCTVVDGISQRAELAVRCRGLPRLMVPVRVTTPPRR
jgi:hypothetical protein